MSILDTAQKETWQNEVCSGLCAPRKRSSSFRAGDSGRDPGQAVAGVPSVAAPEVLAGREERPLAAAGGRVNLASKTSLRHSHTASFSRGLRLTHH